MKESKKSEASGTYKNPKAPNQLITTISQGCKTPIIPIKFCNLIKPFYYPNSPTIPRYSITCVLEKDKHDKFLTGLQTIEKNEGVDSIIKKDSIKSGDERLYSGHLIIKFQSKDVIPIFIKNEDLDDMPVNLEDEFAPGEYVSVIFDILRYTKKNTIDVEHGLSFKPTTIFYYPEYKCQ